jgi:hypothetical protein
MFCTAMMPVMQIVAKSLATIAMCAERRAVVVGL